MLSETVTLGESGRVVLPAVIRKEFGLKAGDRLTITSDEHNIRISSMEMALASIRAGIIAQRGSLEGILDEFLEEREQERRREAAE